MKKVVQELKNLSYHFLLIIVSIIDLIKSLRYFTKNKIQLIEFTEKLDLVDYLNLS